MNKKSKFLPESISRVLRNLSLRTLGILFCLISIWLIFALFFYNPYLSGFAAQGSFGTNGIIGNIVAFTRYVIGFIPAMFLFMCLGRFGLSLFIGWDEERAFEYNFLRGFVTLCIGCAAFGLIVPHGSFGGLFGAIVGRDIGGLLGAGSLPVGILLLALFMFMAGILLHIKWHHVMGAIKTTWKLTRWLLSAFRLIKPLEPVDEEITEDEEQETEE